MQGEWLDVPAAVTIAAMRSELALVSDDSPPTPTHTLAFTLRTAGDEPVTLHVARAAPAPDHAASSGVTTETLSITVVIGRFGDARRERAFADALAQRLREMAGRDVAPP